MGVSTIGNRPGNLSAYICPMLLRHAGRARLPLVGPGRYRVAFGKVWTEACEINVVDDCNLRCRSCSHLSPVMPRSALEPGDVGRDLGRLARVYHARVVRLLGGEPLLHPQLLEMIEVVRASGICDLVRLCTNGVLLSHASADLWAALDEIVISSYPGFEPSESEWEAIEARASEHDTVVTLNHVDRFRYSYSEQPTTDSELSAQVFATCHIAHVWRCHTLAEGRLYRCGQSLYLPPMLGLERGPSFDVEGSLDELLAFLEAPEPLPACRSCLGSVGRRFPHVQMRSGGWRTEQDLPYEELLDRHLLEQGLHG